MGAGKPWRARPVVQIRVDNGLDQGAGGRADGLLVDWIQGQRKHEESPALFPRNGLH